MKDKFGIKTIFFIAGLLLVQSGSALAASSTVQSVITNPAPVITTPATANSSTTTTSTVVSGSANPNTTVQVFDNNSYVISVHTNASGSFTAQVPLSVGNNQITVQQPGAPTGSDTPVLSQPITIMRRPSFFSNYRNIALAVGGSLAGLTVLGTGAAFMPHSGRRL